MIESKSLVSASPPPGGAGAGRGVFCLQRACHALCGCKLRAAKSHGPVENWSFCVKLRVAGSHDAECRESGKHLCVSLFLSPVSTS